MAARYLFRGNLDIDPRRPSGVLLQRAAFCVQKLRRVLRNTLMVHFKVKVRAG